MDECTYVGGLNNVIYCVFPEVHRAGKTIAGL
jgi:hypothetical protein